LAVTAEIAATREVDDREVTSRERFQRVLTRLGAKASLDAADRLVAAHMTRLADALVLPPNHLAVVASLGRTHRLGIVTNFDHAPTVHDVLARDGLSGLFEVVVISGEIGWRKPHRMLFDAAVEGLGVSADETLFVGDNFELDVVGATQAGLTAAWYTRGRAADRKTSHPVITDLADLDRLL
jgi:putative hydrolase of the HAD superfamily